VAFYLLKKREREQGNTRCDPEVFARFSVPFFGSPVKTCQGDFEINNSV
jgi:hypothetical protein